MAGLGLISRRRAIASSPTAGNDYIKFADTTVADLCIANYSTDGVGVTKADALAVTDIDKTFMGTQIVSFDEFEMFGVTQLRGQSGRSSFQNCTALQSIKLPDTITSYIGGGHDTSNGGYGIFWGCTSLTYCKMSANFLDIPGAMFWNCPLEVLDIDWSKIVALGRYAINKGSLSVDTLNLASLATYGFKALSGMTARKMVMPNITTLPQTNYEVNLPKGLKILDLGDKVTTLPHHSLYGFGANTFIIRTIIPPTIKSGTFNSAPAAIYVPDESVDAYKAAQYWSNYAAKIQPLSSYSE